jgi:hypothetical protein
MYAYKEGMWGEEHTTEPLRVNTVPSASCIRVCKKIELGPFYLLIKFEEGNVEGSGEEGIFGSTCWICMRRVYLGVPVGYVRGGYVWEYLLVM